MLLLEELFLLNEESKARRAWEGKLKKIDALMGWMYEKDILTPNEKKDKDRIFYQYYRYYNDGDLPSIVKRRGVGIRSGKNVIERELEDALDSFIKKILSKYLPTINRTEFRLDNLLKQLSMVKRSADEEDSYGLLNYWLKSVKIKDDEGALFGIVEELKKAHEAMKDSLGKADSKKGSMVMSYARKQMKNENTWTPELEAEYKELADSCKKVSEFIDNIITGTRKLKDALSK